MPHTKAQVQAAFKRARAHFRGKIPKGTKLFPRFGSGHSSTSSSHSPGSKSHSRSRFRAIAGRGRAAVRRHPKLTTQAVNVAGALIAFSPEIGVIATDFQNGTLFSNPQQSLKDLLYRDTGINLNTGTVDASVTQTSALAKVGGYVFIKVAKFFLRRFRM